MPINLFSDVLCFLLGLLNSLQKNWQTSTIFDKLPIIRDNIFQVIWKIQYRRVWYQLPVDYPMVWYHLPRLWCDLPIIWYHLPLAWYHLTMVWYHLPMIWHHLPMVWYHLSMVWYRYSKDIEVLNN